MEELAVISIKPSRIAIHLHGVVLGLAFIAIAVSGILLVFKCLLALLLLLAGLQQIRRQQKISMTHIGYGAQHWWAIMEDKKITLELCGEQLILPWLVVMRWREIDTGKMHAIAFWPDSAGQDDLRRLRVFLRFGGA